MTGFLEIGREGGPGRKFPGNGAVSGKSPQPANGKSPEQTSQHFMGFLPDTRFLESLGGWFILSGIARDRRYSTTCLACRIPGVLQVDPCKFM